MAKTVTCPRCRGKWGKDGTLTQVQGEVCGKDGTLSLGGSVAKTVPCHRCRVLVESHPVVLLSGDAEPLESETHKVNIHYQTKAKQCKHPPYCVHLTHTEQCKHPPCCIHLTHTKWCKHPSCCIHLTHTKQCKRLPCCIHLTHTKAM